MGESYNIHPNLGYPLVTKSLEMPHQMFYLNQSCEAYDVPHESVNFPNWECEQALMN